MPSLSLEVFNRLTAPGARLDWLRDWLLGEIWTPRRYEDFGAVEFLNRGEREVNEIEEVLAAAAPRIYDELQTDPPADRHLRAFLESQQPCAAVVFDGLSLREVPMVLRLATEGGFPVRQLDVTTAAVPSETVDFVAQRLQTGRVSPSELPRRRELRQAGIEVFYYGHEGQRHQLPVDCPAMCLWSAFPDQTYQDSGARFANHFAELHRRLEAVWRNTVQAVPPGRTIVVTSDHGYVFFGPGCSSPRTNQEIRPLTEWLGGERSRPLEPGLELPPHRDLAVIASRQVTMVRGRVQTHPPGPGGARLYKHGGLSVMEMLTPWIVLEAAHR